MLVSRDTHASIPASPLRTLYGRRGSRLLAPLDLCTFQMAGAAERFEPAILAGSLIGATVRSSSGAIVGTIESYSWPPPTPASLVDPIVVIDPDPGVDLTLIPVLPSVATGVTAPAGVSYPSPVTGSPIPGRIIQVRATSDYPDMAHQVGLTYLVEILRNIPSRDRGARVALDAGGLAGMLLATANQNGTCSALILPFPS